MITVLIPAFNEEDLIAETVKAALQVPDVGQLIVVDDGSQDGTALKAKEAGAQVISLGSNYGKGEALNRGIPYINQPVVALLDGDLCESACQLELLAGPVLANKADMTIATFPPVKKAGGFGLVKGLARAGIYLLTGLKMEAPLSGQRVMRREVLDAVAPFAAGYGVELAMTIKAARRGFRLQEVPTTMFHRVTGRDLSGFMHRGRQFKDVLLALISSWKEVAQ